MTRSSNAASHSTDPVYQEVVDVNQSSTGISEAETDILSPGFRFTRFQPGEPSELIVDEQQEKVHRIDSKHATIAPSHLSMRLQKFVALTQHYTREEEAEGQGGVETQIAEPDSSTLPPRDSEPSSTNPSASSISSSPRPPADTATFRATANWDASTLQKFVVSPPDKTSRRAQTSRPVGESTLTPTPVRTRVDAKHSLARPHFAVAPVSRDANLTPPAEESTKPASVQPAHEGLLWQAERLQWPAITSQLLEDPSNVIDKIGSNIVKLMTGVQNQLAVASTRRGEGTTTLAISLARWARSQGKQVLLIDADLANADLTSSIGLDTSISWLSAINDTRKIGKSIIQDQDSGVFVMPLSAMVDRSNLPSDIYQALGQLLESISDCFDFIVMDIGTTQQFLNETSRIDLVADVALLVQDVAVTENAQFVQAKSNVLSAGIAKMIVAQNSTGAASS